MQGEKVIMLDIERIPMLADNYAWLLRDGDSGMTAIVDPGEAAPVIDVVGDGRLDLIILTHHHPDHVDGVEPLRRRYGAQVAGPASESGRLPPLDIPLADGDRLTVGDSEAEVIATPGHANGHIAFFFPSVPALFSGDALFSLGCGRLLEGTAEELFTSLRRFDGLPDETLVCCGHEYTLGNARFAVHLDPDDAEMTAYAERIRALRAAGEATVPSTLALERRLNPFLRAPDAATFGTMRRQKDSF